VPNRILREGILSSERVALLTWQEEVFYRRLMSVVDDFGRFHANPKLLRSACYPLHIDKVSDADIGKWLTSCVTAALVSVYPAPDGKRYLEMHDFRQQTRAKVSKYPPMQSTCVADATQTPSTREASARLYGDGDGYVYEKEKRGARVPPQAAFCPPEWIPTETWQAYLDVRKAKRAGKGSHALGLIVRDLQRFRDGGLDAVAILETSIKSAWVGVFSLKAAGSNGSHVSSVLTVPSKAAEITAAQLHSDTMTPEQSEAAHQAARLAMAKLGRIAA